MAVNILQTQALAGLECVRGGRMFLKDALAEVAPCQTEVLRPQALRRLPWLSFRIEHGVECDLGAGAGWYSEGGVNLWLVSLGLKDARVRGVWRLEAFHQVKHGWM